MVSFISILPIFLFLLFNGYFALPIVDDQFSTSTDLSGDDLVITGQTFNIRSVANDESSTWSDIHPKHSTDEHMEFEMSTSIGGLAEEISPAPRSIEEFSTPDGMLMTTEQSSSEKRAYDDLLSSTSESLVFTTEQTHSDKRENDDLSYTTIESTTELAQLNRRGFVDQLENNTQQMKVELTTNDMSSFPSTSSAKFSKLSRSSSIPTTTTKKYIGLLKDNNEYDEEEEEKSTTKSTKISRKSSGRKSKVYSEDKSNDEDSNIPTAVFDQKALDRVPNIPNDFLMLDESNDLLVTSLSNRISPSTTTTHQNSNEEEEETQPLNQGKNSAYTKEKESDN